MPPAEVSVGNRRTLDQAVPSKFYNDSTPRGKTLFTRELSNPIATERL